MQEIRAEQAPEQQSWDARYFVSEGGKPRLHILADYMQQFTQGDSTYMVLEGRPDSVTHRVTAYFFGENGDSTATLTADRVLYYDREGRFEARGRVIVVTREQKKLESEHLVWYEAERKVRTPGFARITTPKERIQGYGLVADEDLRNYQLGRISAQLAAEDS